MVSAMTARATAATRRAPAVRRAVRRPATSRRRVPAGDEGRHAGKGDPEQQHEDRDAADDLDIEARRLAQPSRPRQRHQRDRRAPAPRPWRTPTMVTRMVIQMPLRDGAENLGVEVVGGDDDARRRRRCAAATTSHQGKSRPPAGSRAVPRMISGQTASACRRSKSLLAHAAAPLVDLALRRPARSHAARRGSALRRGRQRW